jgi:hypothetical protein
MNYCCSCARTTNIVKQILAQCLKKTMAVWLCFRLRYFSRSVNFSRISLDISLIDMTSVDKVQKIVQRFCSEVHRSLEMESPEQLISVIVEGYAVKLMRNSGCQGVSHFPLCAVFRIVGFHSQFILEKQNKSFRRYVHVTVHRNKFLCNKTN